MSLDEKLDYKGYSFKFNENEFLSIKSIEEIKHINDILKEESPESDYDSYSWYLSVEEAEKIKYKKLKVTMQISWHVGIPFYRLKSFNDDIHSIAEFYLQKYVSIEPDSRGLVLNKTFQNIPKEEGVHIVSRVPIKVKGLEAAYETSNAWGHGMFSIIFLASDVQDMSDDEIITVARSTPLADVFQYINVRRKGDVVYTSFGYHRISRIPGAKKF